MALLSTLRHRVYTYLSPAGTDRDRNRTSSSSTSSRLEPRLDRRSMSPATRTKNWLARNTPSTDSSHSRTPSILAVQGSKIIKHSYRGKSTLTPLFEAKYRDERYWDAPLYNKKAAGAADDDDEDMDDVKDDAEEDDDDDDEEDDADDLANDTTLVAADDDDDDLANDTTLVAAADDEEDDEDEAGGEAPKITQAELEEVGVGVDMDKERAEREAAVTGAEKGDWTDAEIALFQKLNMRGFEPLLPGTWRMDFNTIPEPLFTHKDDEVFIGSTSGHDFRAIKALSSLLTIGIRGRDRAHMSQPPEEPMRREIESYIRWSERDAGLSRENYIPILAVSAAQAGQGTQDVIDNVTAKLQHLADRYRKKWRIHPTVEGSGENDEGDKTKEKGQGKEKEKRKAKEEEKGNEKEKEKGKEKEKEKQKQEEDTFEHELPTLYGVVIAHTIVAVVTLNANHPDKPVRSVALFDFNDDEQDVWNAFAIAIVVVLARNYLVSLRQFDGAGAGPAQNANDPDA